MGQWAIGSPGSSRGSEQARLGLRELQAANPKPVSLKVVSTPLASPGRALSVSAQPNRPEGSLTPPFTYQYPSPKLERWKSELLLGVFELLSLPGL